MRPLLRWAGSKKQLLGHLTPYWQGLTPKRYVEPFAGSAALFFALEPRRAILADTNPVLAQFYRTLCLHADDLYEIARSWTADAKTYYAIRSAFHAESDNIVRSAMFFYLNRNCFNGIFRTNLRNEFNVPFASTKTGAMPDWVEVEAAVKLLQRAEIKCADFRSIVKLHVSPGDFVFLDPPYAVENRRVFVQYNAQTFGLNDLEHLADLLHCIDALGANFVLSYAVSREALHLFSCWDVRKVACQRNVAGFAAHRRKAMELMISNIPNKRGGCDE